MIEPIQWRAIENVIHFWMSESTGLKTIWQNQDAPQPTWPYATLNVIAGPLKVGQDGVRYEIDGDNLNACYNGMREFTVSCQVDGGPRGKCETEAREFLTAAQFALGLPKYRDRFREVELSVVDDNGPVQSFDLVVGETWITRSTLDIRFYTAANLIETGADWFNEVEISSDMGTGNPSLELDNETFGGP